MKVSPHMKLSSRMRMQMKCRVLREMRMKIQKVS